MNIGNGIVVFGFLSTIGIIIERSGSRNLLIRKNESSLQYATDTEQDDIDRWNIVYLDVFKLIGV